MKPIIKLTLVFFFLLSTMNYQLLTAEGAIPHLINYQGRLTDSQGKPLVDGKYKISFKLYETEGGGSAIWTEVHDPAQGTGIDIQKGIFSVMLGGVTPLNLTFDKPYYLGIQVGSDPEMTPRQRLASIGYAFKAENADNAAQAQNANAVDNIGISTTPAANKILPLDANAKFPSSALGLKAYDSGWFPVSTAEPRTKVLTHNLGTTKVLMTIWFSTAADGSSNVSNVVFVKEWANGNKSRGVSIRDMTTTTCNIVWGYTAVQSIPNASTDDIEYYSGYYRVIMFAF